MFPSRPPGNCCSARPGGGGAAPTSPLPMPVSSLLIPHCGSSCRTPLGFSWLDLGWVSLQGRQPKAAGTYSTRESRKRRHPGEHKQRGGMKLGGSTHSRPEAWLDLGSARGSLAVSSSQGPTSITPSGRGKDPAKQHRHIFPACFAPSFPPLTPLLWFPMVCVSHRGLCSLNTSRCSAVLHPLCPLPGMLPPSCAQDTQPSDCLLWEVFLTNPCLACSVEHSLLCPIGPCSCPAVLGLCLPH